MIPPIRAIIAASSRKEGNGDDETFVRLEVRERVAHLALDRPNGSGIHLEMAQALADTAARLADDPASAPCCPAVPDNSAWARRRDLRDVRRSLAAVHTVATPALHLTVALGAIG
jgi:hypothetical protein